MKILIIKMKKKLYQTIEIPEGVEVSVEENTIVVKGPEGENKREFKTLGLDFEKKGNNVVIGSEKSTKMEKKYMNTITAHIKNMIKGVQKKFEYKLKVCSSHFPVTIDIKEREGIIKNFLGEKVPRKVKIPEKVEVKKDNDFLIVTSLDKELAGQAAANFEKATNIRKKDRRIFQDGIFIVNKNGKEI